MVKSKGNYIAVKVDPGAFDFELVGYKLDWKTGPDQFGRVDLYHEGCEWEFKAFEDAEIIGLISEQDYTNYILLDEDIKGLMKETLASEFNQWLIIKKAITGKR